MVPPVLPFGSTSGVGATSNAGMRHTARRRIETSQRTATQEEMKGRTWGPPFCCHLQSIGDTLANVAAASGFKATWTFKADPCDVELAAGQRFQVDRGRQGIENVTLTGPLMKKGRVMNLWGAVDTPLNAR